MQHHTRDISLLVLAMTVPVVGFLAAMLPGVPDVPVAPTMGEAAPLDAASLHTGAPDPKRVVAKTRVEGPLGGPAPTPPPLPADEPQVVEQPPKPPPPIKPWQARCEAVIRAVADGQLSAADAELAKQRKVLEELRQRAGLLAACQIATSGKGACADSPSADPARCGMRLLSYRVALAAAGKEPCDDALAKEAAALTQSAAVGETLCGAVGGDDAACEAFATSTGPLGESMRPNCKAWMKKSPEGRSACDAISSEVTRAACVDQVLLSEALRSGSADADWLKRGGMSVQLFLARSGKEHSCKEAFVASAATELCPKEQK